MSKVDVYCTLPHYAAHIEPIWAALPEERRGVWYGTVGPKDGGPARRSRPDPAPGRPVLVAGMSNAHQMGRPVILLEHGAGQTYRGDPLSADHGSYAGGAGWDHAIGFLCPNEEVARAWRDTYEVPAHVTGCPRLDQFRNRDQVRTLAPVVAFTWHWENLLIPETRSALAHYRDHLEWIVGMLRTDGFVVVGHQHPRWRNSLDAMWAHLSVPQVSADEVLATAAVLVADNTSLLYEAAAVGIPTVTLDAPWYRADVHHGLRFWSHVPGISTGTPTLVPEVVRVAHTDPVELRELRALAAVRAYARASNSTPAAVSAIVDLLDRQES